MGPIFSLENFALKFLEHRPIFAGNLRSTGISQLQRGKTRSKRPRSHCLSTVHLLPYMWASFYPLDPSRYLSSFSSWRPKSKKFPFFTNYPASGERLRELTAPGSNSPQTTIRGARRNRPRKMKNSKETNNKKKNHVQPANMVPIEQSYYVKDHYCNAHYQIASRKQTSLCHWINMLLCVRCQEKKNSWIQKPFGSVSFPYSSIAARCRLFLFLCTLW